MQLQSPAIYRGHLIWQGQILASCGIFTVPEREKNENDCFRKAPLFMVKHSPVPL